jgi:hypothetical protein
LVYPDEGEQVRKLEKDSGIPAPNKERLVEIRKDLIGRRRAAALAWEARNLGWERKFPSDVVPLIREDLNHAKRLPSDENGNDITEYFEPLIGEFCEWPKVPSQQQSSNANYIYWHQEWSKRRKSQNLVTQLAGMYEKQLLDKAKDATKEIWPELWQPLKEGEAAHETERRALAVLYEMRDLLRAFWSAKEKRARDWYIHRAREYYQRHFILPKTSTARRDLEDAYEEVKKASSEDHEQPPRALNQLPQLPQALAKLSFAVYSLNREIEQLLNEPPAKNLFEDALFKLQQHADEHPSRAPHKCENRHCARRPYFLKSKTKRRYCSVECKHEAKRKRDLKLWHEKKHEYRPSKREAK